MKPPKCKVCGKAHWGVCSVIAAGARKAAEKAIATRNPQIVNPLVNVPTCSVCGSSDPAEVAYALDFLRKHRERSREGQKKYREKLKKT